MFSVCLSVHIDNAESSRLGTAKREGVFQGGFYRKFDSE